MNPATNRIEFSVVICSIDAEKFARVSANYSRLLSGRGFEIIGIHDARSLAEGYMRGISASNGRLLLLSHDDIEILTLDFAQRVARHLETYDLVGVAGTTRLVGGKWTEAGDPYKFVLMTTPDPSRGTLNTLLIGGRGIVVPEVQALDGVFWAMRREVAERVGFDAGTFDHFHLYDLDFTYRAYLAGYQLAVCRDLAIIHDSPGRFDAVWASYKVRFEQKFAGRLAPKPPFRQGPAATFVATSREETRMRCEPAQVAAVIARIEAANARL